jgi:hypothetical protein
MKSICFCDFSLSLTVAFGFLSTDLQIPIGLSSCECSSFLNPTSIVSRASQITFNGAVIDSKFSFELDFDLALGHSITQVGLRSVDPQRKLPLRRSAVFNSVRYRL